jgi:hypothetical protein
VAISKPILDEVLRILREKFKRSEAELAEAEERIRSFTQMVAPTESLLAKGSALEIPSGFGSQESEGTLGGPQPETIWCYGLGIVEVFLFTNSRPRIQMSLRKNPTMTVSSNALSPPVRM